MSADSMAMSLPLPMAQPTVAAVRAGASLMPSPTIITLRPWDWSRSTTPAFSSGSTSAMTSSTPTREPMCSAAARLSPVSSTVRMPCSFIFRMAAALVSFTGSATEIRPSRAPLLAKYMGVWPWAASRSASDARGVTSTPCSSSRRRLPARTVSPSSSALRPRPDRFSKRSGRAVPPKPWAWAYAVMAFARGWADTASTAAAADSRSSAVH